METSKSIKKNTIFYLIYTIINITFPFITGIYVARVLLPSAVGDVTAAQNFAQYFVILAFLGIPTYGLREISKVKNDKIELNKVYSELMTINFISTIVFLTIYFILIFSIPSYNARLPLFLITGLSIAFNVINNQFLFEGLEDFKSISIRNVIFKILAFTLLVLFVKGPKDYLIYALLNVVGIAGNYFISIIYAKKYVKFSFKNLNLKRHMKSIFYLVIVNLAIELYTLTDITMLDFMTNSNAVTFYSYGSKISKILLQVMNCFTIVIVPKLSEYHQNGKNKEFNFLLRKGLIILLLLALPMIVGIFFTANFLICFIYGEAYFPSVSVLIILSFNLLISPVGYLLGSRVMLCCNEENKMIYPVGLGAFFNIVINFILIPILQEDGAAIASVIGEIVVMFTYLIISHKHFHFKKISFEFFKVGLSTVFMLVILYFISTINISAIYICAIQLILGPFTYFILLILLKEEITYEMIKKKIFKNRS